MSEDKVKILYGAKAVSYKNGKREEIPPEKTECLYKPSQPIVNNIEKDLRQNGENYKFSLLELKLLRNGILETITHKNYCGFKESDHRELLQRLDVMIFTKKVLNHENPNKDVDV